MLTMVAISSHTKGESLWISCRLGGGRCLCCVLDSLALGYVHVPLAGPPAVSSPRDTASGP